tara:strand:- start:5828 stop:6451 length:624 start_codon:yes stop_codon:yes gene_type:complete
MNNEILKRIISSIILIPISLFFIIKGSYFFLFFLFIIFLATSYEWHHMSKNKPYYIFGLIFLFLSFVSAYLFRATFFLYDFLILIIICVFTDIGGYIFGKLLKGPKLTKISPNKTYAGMFGGYILSIISYSFFVENYTLNQIQLSDIGYVLLVSSISQLGDLAVSYFKRRSKIKNTGNLLPGHGGVLDRIDGLIFVLPIIYAYNLFI